MKKENGVNGFNRASAGYILILCSLLYMINYMDRQALSITTEYIRADLGLTDTQMGIIQTVFFMSMALFSFPAAFLNRIAALSRGHGEGREPDSRDGCITIGRGAYN